MKKILLATDGSEGAAHAVGLLERLPLARQADVEVLHVVERAAPFLHEAGVHPEERDELGAIAAELEANADRILEETSRRLKGAGWRVRATHVTGEASAGILEAAEASKVDVIVLGATGRDAHAETQLGRTARRVLKRATSSVLVARPRETGHEERTEELRLLIALDGSAASEAAADLAHEVASPSTQVTLLSVVTVATTLYGYDIRERMSATWRAHTAEIEAELERIAERLRAVSEHVETRVLDGGTDAVDEILDAIRILRPDLAVLGRSGKGAFKKMVLGSVSEAIVELAPCSVWIGPGTAE